MPSTSKKQHNLMAAVAHNPEFAKKVGVPQSVGKDFNAADKGKKFGRGGMSDATVQSINKPKTNHGAEALFKKGGTSMATKKMDPRVAALMAARMSKVGAAAPSAGPVAAPPMPMSPAGAGGPPGMKRGGKSKETPMKKMAKGGMSETLGPKNMGSDVEKGSNKNSKFGEHGIQKKGHTKGTQVTMSGNKGMKRGGKA